MNPMQDTATHPLDTANAPTTDIDTSNISLLQNSTVLQVLTKDHEYTKELVEKIYSTPESDLKTKYKNSFVRHLSRSLVATEMVVYPIVYDILESTKFKEDRDEMITTLKDAHVKIKEDLHEIDQMVPIQADFGNKVDKMMELLTAVNKRERELVTELGDAAFSNKNGTNPLIDEKYASDYLSAKESAPTRPHSNQPLSNPLVQAAACACETPFDKIRDAQREFAD